MSIEGMPDPTSIVNIDFSLDDVISKTMLDKRLILFTGEIDLDGARDASRSLEYMALRNNKPIKIILNSVGGEVYAGLLLYNTIKDVVDRGIDVIIEVRGLCASMGTVVLQAGSKRLAAKRSRFLLHEISDWTFGKVTELQEGAKEAKIVNQMMAEILAERCKKKTSEILSYIKKK